MGWSLPFYLTLSCLLFAGCTGDLYKAAMYGDAVAIKSLVAAGADINAFDGTVNFYTPLMAAAMEGRKDAVTALLELGADPLAEDADGLTAAKLARKKRHEDIADILDEAVARRLFELGPGAPVTRPPSSKPEDAEFVQPPTGDDNLEPQSPLN